MAITFLFLTTTPWLKLYFPNLFKVLIAIVISALSFLLGFVLEKFPFFKVNSGLKVNELIVLIPSLLSIFMISFKIAASPSLALLIILGK